MITVNEIKSRLKPLNQNKFIRKVILFGSYAKGDVSRKSDIDLVVIMDTDKRFFDRFELCNELYDLFDTSLDILPYTLSEFNQISHRGFIKSIIRGGIVVHES